MAKRRKRGAGSIHLRKDGRWEGRVVVGYDDKNLPITKNVLAKTKAECAAKLNKLKESLAPPEPETPKNSTTASPTSARPPGRNMRTPSTSTSSRRWEPFHWRNSPRTTFSSSIPS